MSGHGNNYVQDVPANQPHYVTNAYNGLPAIRGDADMARALVDTGFTRASQATYVLVLSRSGRPSTYQLQGDAANAIAENFSTGSGGFFWSNGTDTQVFQSGIPTAGLHMLAITQVDGSSLVGYYDGARVFSVAPTASIGPVKWLMNSSGLVAGTDGDFAEVMAFDRALSDPEIALLHTYIQGFWGTPF
jgi:hypothetical protein